LVSVAEEGMQNDAQGIARLGRNSEGQANFLACLEAYFEYGINLRVGGFKFLRNDQKPQIKKPGKLPGFLII